MGLKKLLCILCMLVVMASLFPAVAEGVLKETELAAWVDEVLRCSAPLTPMNAPVGEEALTEDGYAFLYDFATLYYDKPVLDASSVLQAVSITDDRFAGQGGICLGSSTEALTAAFGVQNPYLLGDGTFAVFYRVNELPSAAYWSWAQLDE